VCLGTHRCQPALDGLKGPCQCRCAVLPALAKNSTSPRSSPLPSRRSRLRCTMPPPSPSLQLGIITEQEITCTPCSRAQRMASKNFLGESGSQVAKNRSAPGTMALITSAHCVPWVLPRTSSLPSDRKDLTVIFFGSVFPRNER